METLDGSGWDVLIVGTDLQQSLLALALSRSGKKILHIDKNDYYGGSEAAFSLQEAEEFEKKIAEDSSFSSSFSNVSITKPTGTEPDSNSPKLSSSRAYSLALSPQLIYARSSLLQLLVSSKVYRQLDFLAVGSWWVHSSARGPSQASDRSDGRLFKVPNGREDIFADNDLDFKQKRGLMKFLRFLSEYEDESEFWEGYRGRPFSELLSEKFKLPPALHNPFLALTLSTSCWDQTTTEYALPQIARHLQSIGMFGPGFAAVVPKWGGLSEMTQVACRAAAVGGAVYVLDKGLSASVNASQNDDSGTAVDDTAGVKVRLKNGETVSAHWIVASESDLQAITGHLPSRTNGAKSTTFSKAIAIVSSSLEPLFPALAEGAPSPAGSVVVFPGESLRADEPEPSSQEAPPVYIIVHSADTGECPSGQCVLYASIALEGGRGFAMLDRAIQSLLQSNNIRLGPVVLWSMQYEQHYNITSASSEVSSAQSATADDRILAMSSIPPDLALDDTVLEDVEKIWRKVMGDDAENFMVFDDREGMTGEDDNDE